MSILHFLLLYGDMAVTVSDLRITLYIIEYHENKIILYICQPEILSLWTFFAVKVDGSDINQILGEKYCG